MNELKNDNPFMSPLSMPTGNQKTAEHAKQKPPIWIRIYSILLTISGAIFVPFSWYPILTPGLLIWLGWLSIGIGKQNLNVPVFWFCSVGFNALIMCFLLWLRNGRFGPLDWGMVFMWTHLTTAILGSAFLFVYTSVRIAKKVPNTF